MASGSRRSLGTRTSSGTSIDVLILTSSEGNGDAEWLHRRLTRAFPNVMLLTIDDFMRGEVALTVNDRDASWTASLPDGTTVSSNSVERLLCLAQRSPVALVQDIAKADRRYAYDEITATFSALTSIVAGRVINPPDPPTL